VNRKTKISTPDEHLETMGDLLTQCRARLTASAEAKGTYGGYLRLLEFYRETSDEQAKEIIIGWVENYALAL
jgi:hypothetical protein